MTSASPEPSDARTDAANLRPTGNPASAVYGTVLAGSLRLAHVYAELVGRRIGTRQRPFRGEVRELLRDEWPLVAASFGPLIAIVVIRVVEAGANTAVLVGLWVNAVVLAGWAVFAGRRARLRPAELVLYVVASFAFGAVLVLLKVLLH